MTFVSRLERFDAIDSTQRVIREWLESGTPEVCIAVADEQLQGRGRNDRTWTAPPGTALLVSAGFTPTRIAPAQGWRVAATCALAMLNAAEEAAGLQDGTLWLKWPNDVVVEGPDRRLLKIAGVLGETQLDGERVSSAVIGLGVNGDWASSDFPEALRPSMSSLREAAAGRPIDRDLLLQAWLDRLEPRIEALYAGSFDAGEWSLRQRTTGRRVEIDLGGRTIEGTASGVDPMGGGLLLEADGERVTIDSGDVLRCRVVVPLAPSVRSRPPCNG